MMPTVTIRLSSKAAPSPHRGEVVISPSLAPAVVAVEVDESIALPPIPRDLQEQYSIRLRQTLAALSEKNSNPDWWYLPVSELQPQMSSILNALELEAQITVLVKELKNSGRAHQLVLSVPDARSSKYLFETDLGCKVTATFTDKCVWAVDRAKDIYRRFFNGVIWGLQHGYNVLASRNHDRLLSDIDTLFVSRIEADIESSESSIFQSPWEDRYLGSMVEDGLQNGNVAMLIRCGGDPKKIGEFCSRYSRFPIRTVHQMLGLLDVAHVLFRAFCLRLRSPGDAPLFRMIVSESRNHVRAVADCVLVEVAMKKVLRRTKPGQIICMQENSVWEHAVVRAARKSAPSSRLIGYFHCPVMPSAFRYHCWSEVNDRPMFDAIIPLGDAMASAICKLGNWKPLLWPGYGFRNPDIEKQLKIIPSRPRKPFQLVVLLGGMFDNTVFLKWVNYARDGIPALKFLIKGHPVYGSKIAIEGAEIKLTPEGDIEDISSLAIAEALKNADCVVYKGTTVGISALAAGIPAIHVDHGGLEVDDALFDADGLAISVNNAIGFKSAILKIMNMNEADRREWSERAKKYAASYYNLSAERKKILLAQLFEHKRAVSK